MENRFLDIYIPAIKEPMLLIELSGEDYISYPFYFDLLISSKNTKLTGKKLVGEQITIRIGYSESEFQYYNGLIYGLSREKNQINESQQYRLTMYPWFRFLADTKNSKIYCTKKPLTIPDIIKQVFKKYNYRNYEFNLTKKYKTISYCVQYQESDFNFISRLLERSGIYYTFRHSIDQHILLLSDSGFFSKKSGNIQYSKHIFNKQHILEWRKNYKLQPPSRGTKLYRFQDPDNLINVKTGNQTTTKIMSKLKQFYYGDTPPDSTMEELSKKEQLIINGNLLKSEICTAKSSYLQLKTGSYLKLKNHEEYIVYAIAHHARDFSCCTTNNNEITQSYINNLKAYPAKKRFVPQARYDETQLDKHEFLIPEKKSPYFIMIPIHKPLISTMQTAIVVGPKNREIYTDKYGRIKIQFMWDKDGKYDEYSSCWVRTKQLLAGNDYGINFIPRIGQEVLVGFEFSDPDKPLVLGTLPNLDHLMPFDQKPNSIKQGIKTHSFGCEGNGTGNSICFENSKEYNAINIKAQRNMQTSVKGDSQHIIGGNSNTIIRQGNYINTADEIIAIQAKEKITFICGNSKIIITDGDITLQSDKIEFN